MKRSSFFIIGIALLVLAAGLLRLNDLSLYTDSTRYLLWAQSLSQFSGWVDTSQPVPEEYVVNAPLYPLFIAPSQWFPVSPIEAAKTLTLLFGIGALGVFFLVTRDTIGESPGVILTMLLAAMPMTIVLFTEVLSEAVFLLLVLLVFLLLQKRDRWSMSQRVLALIVLAFLPLVREIGFALVAAVVIMQFIRGDRRLALTITLTSLGVFALWATRNLLLVGTPDTSQAANVSFILQRTLTNQDESLLFEFVRRIGANVSSYRFELGGMILFPVPFPLISSPSGGFRSLIEVLQFIKPFIGLLFVPTLVYGMWRDWKSGADGSMRVLFILLSFGIVLLYPVQDVRFLYPFLPFFLFFGYRTFEALREWSPRVGLVVGSAVVVFVAISNLVTVGEVIASNQRYNDWLEDPGQSPPGVYYSTPWERTGAWIRENTPIGTVIASSAKEITPFLGDRKLLEVNKAVPRPQFENMLRDHDVTLLVTPTVQDGLFGYGFVLSESYKIHPQLQEQFGSVAIISIPSLLRGDWDATAAGIPDTLLISRSDLRTARSHILGGAYKSADSILAQILLSDPANAEVAFQRVVSLSLARDPAAALDAQQVLFRTPRSTSYIPVSRRMLEIAQHLSNASQMDDPALRSGALFLAARSAWDVGYERAARTFIAEALAADPDGFEPLIWSVFYALRHNDFHASARSLERLLQIDRDDPIVSALAKIDAFAQRLRTTQDPRDRSAIFHDMATQYQVLDLSSYAIDATITSIRLDPTNLNAKEFLLTLLTESGRTYAAERLGMMR